MSAVVEKIQAATAKAFSITLDELLSRNRERHVAEARGIAMMIARDMTTLSYPALGHLFRYRDHTTVITAVRRAHERCAQSIDLAERAAAIRNSVFPLRYEHLVHVDVLMRDERGNRRELQLVLDSETADALKRVLEQLERASLKSSRPNGNGGASMVNAGPVR